MPRFQFTLRDLFLATTLIAVGLPGALWPWQHQTGPSTVIGELAFIVVWLASLTAIGAGIGAPFHGKFVGGTVGFFIALAGIVVAITLPAINSVR